MLENVSLVFGLLWILNRGATSKNVIISVLEIEDVVVYLWNLIDGIVLLIVECDTLSNWDSQIRSGCEIAYVSCVYCGEKVRLQCIARTMQHKVCLPINGGYEKFQKVMGSSLILTWMESHVIWVGHGKS